MDLNTADSPLLRGLSETDLDAVARVATQRDFHTGDHLTTQGDFGHCLFLVESGSADVYVDGRLVRTVGPGDAVGEIAVLASGRRTASVVATAPLRTAVLFKRDVWALERVAPEAAARLRDALAQHRDWAEDVSA